MGEQAAQRAGRPVQFSSGKFEAKGSSRLAVLKYASLVAIGERVASCR